MKNTKTLQELEGQVWSEPEFHSSLVTTCHRLRQKPLSEFTVEDLRIMIGQKIGLPHLMPLAVDVLQDNPLVGGDHYDGDLLSAVLTVDDEFWHDHPYLLQRLRKVVERVRDCLLSLDAFEQETVQEVLKRATRSFLDEQ